MGYLRLYPSVWIVRSGDMGSYYPRLSRGDNTLERIDNQSYCIGHVLFRRECRGAVSIWPSEGLERGAGAGKHKEHHLKEHHDGGGDMYV